MNKLDNFINEAFLTSHIVPGLQIEVSGKNGIITEILDFQNETVYSFAMKADDERMYKAIFIGSMYIISEEIMPEPGI